VDVLDKPLFKLDNIRFGYAGAPALFDGLSLTVEHGESVCILGANGSGKSTLLKILCALLFPEAGVFQAFGLNISEDLLEDELVAREYHRKVGFIFQNSEAQLFNSQVWDEIAYGPRQLGLTEAQTVERVNDVLKLLNIGHLAQKSPHRLSGGEKKKVAVAAALVLNPQVLILDEPTNGLDPKTQRWLVGLLLELNRRGRTIIISTHNLVLAHSLCHLALVFDETHRVVYDGPAAEALNNKELLMDVNLIDEYCHIHEEREHIHLYVHG